MNTFKTYIILFTTLWVFVLADSHATAQETEKGESTPTVQEIVNRTNQAAYYKGQDGRARVSMTITDNQERERTREFIILRRDVQPLEGQAKEKDAFCGDQKFYVYFQRPADVNKMVFMVWKHVDDRLDDRWLYFPALDLVKRIAATDKRTSFVGSHFYYEDVSGRNINDDIHELVETSKTYYVLKNTPKKPDEVEFSYFKMWIHRGTYLAIKTEYYDKEGKKYRVYEALEVKKVQGHHTVMKAKMKDLRTGGETLLEYSDVEYDLGFPDNIFTERYLRRAPTKFLK